MIKIIRLQVFLATALSCHQLSAASIARIWNEQNLAAIRLDFPNPPVHARNLFHTSVAMWDAWAAYGTKAIGYLHNETATAVDVTAARHEAISYAAYRVLTHRYALSVNASNTLAALETQLTSLGYDPNNTTTSGMSPAALGNRVATTVLNFAASDRSNETIFYNDPSYAPINNPLILALPGTVLDNINHWQPLAFDEAFTQNGLVTSKIQIFIGSHWGAVRPFTLELGTNESISLDPGMPPQLGGITDADYKSGVVSVIQHSALLDPASGNMTDISPASRGNNTLGHNDGTGHTVNPVTGLPYNAQIVPHGDYGRVVAEFWAAEKKLQRALMLRFAEDERIGKLTAPSLLKRWKTKVLLALKPMERSIVKQMEEVMQFYLKEKAVAERTLEEALEERRRSLAAEAKKSQFSTLVSPPKSVNKTTQKLPLPIHEEDEDEVDPECL